MSKLSITKDAAKSLRKYGSKIQSLYDMFRKFARFIVEMDVVDLDRFPPLLDETAKELVNLLFCLMFIIRIY
jgi:hypothetical protein